MVNRWLNALVLLLLLSLCALPAGAASVRISAASSLAEAIGEICIRYGAAHPGVTLVRNFAASGTLAKQIVSGAPADLFVSADPKWMDYLVDQGRISRDEVSDLVTNVLVVVGRKGVQVDSLAAMTDLSRIAIGSPKSVPAGGYAEKALRASGVYEQLRQNNRLVMAKDVRQALMYAERGEAEAAFVYRTDALLARDAVILYVVPQELYPRVTYPVGLTVEGKNNQAAKDFFAFLNSQEAAMVLERYGFVVVKKPIPPGKME